MSAADDQIAAGRPSEATSLIGKIAVVGGLVVSLVVCILFVLEFVTHAIDTLQWMNATHPQPTPYLAPIYSAVNYLGCMAGIGAVVVTIPGIALARGRWLRWSRLSMALVLGLLGFLVLVQFAVIIATAFLHDAGA